MRLCMGGPLNSPTIGTILPLAVHAAGMRNQTSDLQDKAVSTHGGCPREPVAGIRTLAGGI